MDWKTPAVLSLLLLAAAAAPPTDCPLDAASDQAMPIPLDLTGRPDTQSGSTDQTFAALLGTLGSAGCRSPLPPNAQPSTLRNDSSDVLHGLPMPDSLRPIGQPKRAPDFE